LSAPREEMSVASERRCCSLVVKLIVTIVIFREGTRLGWILHLVAPAPTQLSVAAFHAHGSTHGRGPVVWEALESEHNLVACACVRVKTHTRECEHLVKRCSGRIKNKGGKAAAG
jgi:hypothetical protein